MAGDRPARPSSGNGRVSWAACRSWGERPPLAGSAASEWWTAVSAVAGDPDWPKEKGAEGAVVLGTHLGGAGMKARCPKCGRTLGFGEDAIGRRGRCGACGQLLAILREGRLYCLEMAPPKKPALVPSPAVFDPPPPVAEPHSLPKPFASQPASRKLKLGDHVGLYQPWVVLLVLGGLIAVLLSRGPTRPAQRSAPAPPARPAITREVAASPSPGAELSSAADTPLMARPAAASSPAPAATKTR